MPYLWDRQRVLWTGDIVAVLAVRQRRERSHVILRDNSLHRTLTRPKTLARRPVIGAAESVAGVVVSPLPYAAKETPPVIARPKMHKVKMTLNFSVFIFFSPFL